MTYILLIICLYLAYYDIRYYKVPNRFTLLLFILVIIQSYYYNRLEKAIIAGFFSLLFYTLVYLITRGKIGIGDIKFSVTSAIYLGWGLWMDALIYSIITVVIISSPLFLAKIINKDSRLPFIPFLVSGIILSKLPFMPHFLSNY